MIWEKRMLHYYFESGARIKDVSQRLGQKSIKVTTDIYIKVTKSR